MHYDVLGPRPIESKGGFQYFVTLVGDYSRITWLYLMRNRLDLLSHLHNFHDEIRNQLIDALKILQSNYAKEYFSHTLKSY